MKVRLFVVLFVAFVAGCAVAYPVQTRERVIQSCQQTEWDGSRWICTATGTEVVTETVMVDGVMYGVVGGFITGYWIGSTWYYGVPYGFRGYGRYRVAPHNYYVPRSGHAIPRGFGRGGRGRR